MSLLFAVSSLYAYCVLGLDTSAGDIVTHGYKLLLSLNSWLRGLYYRTILEYYVKDSYLPNKDEVSTIARKLEDASSWFIEAERFSRSVCYLLTERGWGLSRFVREVREFLHDFAQCRLELDLVRKYEKWKYHKLRRGRLLYESFLTRFEKFSEGGLIPFIREEFSQLLSAGESLLNDLYFLIYIRNSGLVNVVGRYWSAYSELYVLRTGLKQVELRRWLIPRLRILAFLFGKYITLPVALCFGLYSDVVRILYVPTIFNIKSLLELVSPRTSPLIVSVLCLNLAYALSRLKCRILPIWEQAFTLFIGDTVPRYSMSGSSFVIRDILHSLQVGSISARIINKVVFHSDTPTVRLGRGLRRRFVIVFCPSLLLELLRLYTKVASLDFVRVGLLVPCLEKLSEYLREKLRGTSQGA